MGLFDFFSSSTPKSSVDLTDFKFISDDHIRYENGRDVSGHNYGSWRGIRVQSNIQGGKGYTATMYNLNGNHPVWGDNVQMAPKRMQVVEQNASVIKLRGFGADAMGNSFSDYGLTLHLTNAQVEKVTLHMYDRQIDIVYFKASSQQIQPSQTESADFENFKNFISAWKNKLSVNQKLEIAMKTDALNNMGAAHYNNDDLEAAINFFEQALKVMPNNDDALKNLKTCYSEQGNSKKLAEVSKKLNYLQSNK